MPKKTASKPAAKPSKRPAKVAKPRRRAASSPKPARARKAPQRAARAPKVPARFRALGGVDPRTLPPGTPYPCADGYVGAVVRGDKLAGRIVACATPPVGSRGQHFVLGKVASGRAISAEFRKGYKVAEKDERARRGAISAVGHETPLQSPPKSRARKPPAAKRAPEMPRTPEADRPALPIARASVLSGLTAWPVSVEAALTPGLATFDIVGIAPVAARETRTRVRAAMEQSGYTFPLRRIVVTVTNGDKGTSMGLDLAVAVATLVAMGECRAERLADFLLLGELSLTGAVRGVRGVLAQAMAAQQRGMWGVIVASENAIEAAEVDGLGVYAADTLRDVVAFLGGEDRALSRVSRATHGPAPEAYQIDIGDVRGQASAKRALEIAAAGGHHLLMVGPPGGGKTMLARALLSILPEMTRAEALEATAVHSAAGTLRPGVGLLHARPFRAPHHTASSTGLVGGGSPPRPGELSLAHQGVLFLDDLPEFSLETLETLRAPMADGQVTLHRAGERVVLPTRFTLVGGMNPCPCGYAGDASKLCTCPADRLERYLGRVAGPMRDQIALHVRLERMTTGSGSVGPRSAEVRDYVAAARDRAIARQGVLNALHDDKSFGADAVHVLQHGADNLGLSQPARLQVKRVARTIADLEGSGLVRAKHAIEALSFAPSAEISLGARPNGRRAIGAHRRTR